MLSVPLPKNVGDGPCQDHALAAETALQGWHLFQTGARAREPKAQIPANMMAAGQMQF